MFGNDYFNSRSAGSSSNIGVSPGVRIGGRRKASSGQQGKSETNTVVDSDDGSDLEDNR
jgi:hypothetical protein